MYITMLVGELNLSDKILKANGQENNAIVFNDQTVKKRLRKINGFDGQIVITSFAWKSTWGSGDLLKDGLVWRIGNGSTVKIWSDKWVPIPDTYSIQSPPQAHIIEPNATVSELIDRDTQWWNMERLE
jgi:hypothetical protein